MTRNLILLSLLIISALFFAGIAKGDMPEEHKPVPCIGCHKETIGASEGPGECGTCHKYKLPEGGINVPMMQEQHNPNICRACHIGNTEVDGSDRDIIHNAHNTVQCDQCHVSGSIGSIGGITNDSVDNNSGNTINSNFTIIKIEEGKAFQCTSCHGNQIHAIHMKKLGEGCPICHGSWASGRVYKSSNSSPMAAKTQENATLEQFTIFAFIKNLFYALLGIR